MAEEAAKRPIIIIKKKGGHGGHHGGAWKVAYADFVTAMMALFIVLWLLSTSQKTRDAISGYFKDPAGNGKQVGTNIKGAGRDVPAVTKTKEVVKTKEEAVKTKADMQKLKEKLEAAIKMIPNFNKLKTNIVITITEEGLKIELLENSKGMFFESGKPEPSEIGKQVLIALAKEIGKIPNRVLVEGHTDAIPYGSTSYSNWELSADRANEARKIMTSGGLTPHQIAQVRGYADQELRVKDKPNDPGNRRVSLIVQYDTEQPQIKLDSAMMANIKLTPPPPEAPAATPGKTAPGKMASAKAEPGKPAAPEAASEKSAPEKSVSDKPDTQAPAAKE